MSVAVNRLSVIADNKARCESGFDNSIHTCTYLYIPLSGYTRKTKEKEAAESNQPLIIHYTTEAFRKGTRKEQ